MNNGNKVRPGEGNRAADRRYRKGVRETVEETTEQERAEQAREVPDIENDEPDEPTPERES